MTGFNGAGVFRPRKSVYGSVCAASANVASMGPGSFDPGNKRSAKLVVLHPEQLQWGRGLSTPEIRTDCPEQGRPSKLQWGRGLSTPEICGAMTKQPRAASLQWGRGLSTPEIAGVGAVGSMAMRFNGAGVFRPRK